jgi:hypothetical protein
MNAKTHAMKRILVVVLLIPWSLVALGFYASCGRTPATAPVRRDGTARRQQQQHHRHGGDDHHIQAGRT